MARDPSQPFDPRETDLQLSVLDEVLTSTRVMLMDMAEVQFRLHTATPADFDKILFTAKELAKATKATLEAHAGLIRVSQQQLIFIKKHLIP